MGRLRPTEVRAIIVEELDRAGWVTEPTFTIGDGARPGAAALSWWHLRTPAGEQADTKRSVAYLRAYVRIGGDKLYAGGLFLNQRRLWMDRSVMSRLERDGFLRFVGEGSREPYFELTAEGRALVAQLEPAERSPVGQSRMGNEVEKE